MSNEHEDSSELDDARMENDIPIKVGENGSKLGLLSGLTDKPPDNLLDSDETESIPKSADVYSLSQSLGSASSSVASALSIKFYANNCKPEVTTKAIVSEGNDEVADDLSTGFSSSATGSKGENSTDLSRGFEADMDIDTSEEKQIKKCPVAVETPTLRRSSRANKGIGKEIFDPSYIPTPRKSLETSRRVDSPSMERFESLELPLSASLGKVKGRIVVGQSPIRRSPKAPYSQEEKEENEKRGITKKDVNQSKRVKESLEKRKKKNKLKGATTSKRIFEPKRVMSKADFSDDDDNVPLKKFQESATSDEDSDSDDSYNNPDRLWCICRKPHNNRFMISCDDCEDWFHGDCVGITLAQGKKMEQRNEEYVCPDCLKKKGGKTSSFKLPLKKTIEAGKSRNTKQETSLQAKVTSKPGKPLVHKRSAALDEKLKLSGGVSLKGFARPGQSPSSAKFADNEDGPPLKKKLKVQGEGRTDAKKNIDETKKTDATTRPAMKSPRKCTVSTCENDALQDSVYCSNQCILRHAKESLTALASDKQKVDLKPKLLKKSSKDGNSGSQITKTADPKDRVAVICKKTDKILSGLAAPYRRDLSHFLKTHPTYELYRPHLSTSNHTKTLMKSRHMPHTSAEGSKNFSSSDFYRHVEQKNKKRDLYGTDPDYAPPAKKPGDATVNPYYKKHLTATSGTKVGQPSSSKPFKQRRDSSDHPRKPEASKLTERRDSKEHKKKFKDEKKYREDHDHKDLKRKHSTETNSIKKYSEERASKKIERVPSGGSKSESKSLQSGSTDVRQNVKKSLFDILKSRSENSEDLKMHRDSITKLSNKIEESLFKVHGETNTKYKNKYRSIMFNLKDTRNQGLWRKVIIGEVTTSELVQMTAEQMASKKLAEWRQNELTQELDIIQKEEKEKSNVRPIAKITHKGEIAIQEDLSDLTENFNAREANSMPTIAPARKKRISLSEEDHADLLTLSAPNDTTLQHHEHLFDLNCKICTGKIKEEDIEFPEAQIETSKKVKRSTSIILSSEAQSASHDSANTKTPTSQIIVSKSKSLKKKKKVPAVEGDVKSHDTSLSASSFLFNLAEKRKKKPVLPAPPPLSDVVDREKVSLEAAEVQDKSGAKKDSPPVEVKKNVTPPQSVAPEAEVTKPSKSKSKLIWSGSISMLELSTFTANVYPVNGCCDNLDIDLPVRLVLGGRIHPKVVWDYLIKVSALPTKELSVVRFHAATDDDRVGYVAMLSYFSSRKRFGVVSNQDRMLVKDMYLIPLLESQPVPDQLISCSSDIRETLPPNRPSMLLGIIVRQANKMNKPTEINPKEAFVPSTLKTTLTEKVAEEVEYSPGEAPLIPEKQANPKPLLTDEELGAKKENKVASANSLFERNKSLAPSLRFFMRKQSEEEQSRKEREKNINADDEQPYSPSEELKAGNDDEGGDYDPADAIEDEDEEPYDPEKMFQEEEEAYDPETLFPPISPQNDDDIPYDPEDVDDLLPPPSSNKDVDEIAEKQAFLEKMKRELAEEKAKLAEVEQSLQAPDSVADAPTAPVRKDPRLARRAAAQVEEKVPETPKRNVEPKKPVQDVPKAAIETAKVAATLMSTVDPLQTILSVLHMKQSQPVSITKPTDLLSVLQKPASPPQLPDSTTKSDAEDAEQAEEVPMESSTTKQDGNTGLVAYADSPTSEISQDEDEQKKSKKKDERHQRSSSVSSTSSRDSGHKRHRHDHDDKRYHKHSSKKSRSRSPHHRNRHHHRRHDDNHRHHQRRPWSRDRRR